MKGIQEKENWHMDTESDWHCGTERVWLVRQCCFSLMFGLLV